MSDPLVDVPVFDLGPGGVGQTLTLRSFASVGAKVGYLEQLAHAARYDPIVRSLMRREIAPYVAGCTRTEVASAIQAWVARAIGYGEEPEEILETPRHVLAHPHGTLYKGEVRGPDCDDHAVLAAALYGQRGIRWRFVTLGGTPDDPAHLTVAVAPLAGDRSTLVEPARWMPLESWRLPSPWMWAETTTGPQTRFGEAPYEAARRQRLERPDLWQGAAG